jgi:ABC-2 type transport system permease protein
MRLRSLLGLHVFWMTVRETWKGYLIFLLILIFMFGGMVQIYPMFLEGQEEQISEALGIKLEWEDEDAGIANLSWKEVEGAVYYVVLEDPTGFDPTGFENVTVEENFTRLRVSIDLTINITHNSTPSEPTHTTILVNESVNRTYMALTLLEDNNTTMTGIVSTSALYGDNSLNELLEQPIYQGFAGGREIDLFDVRSFLTIEIGGYWALLLGFYVAYLGVAVVSRDVERKSMDLILSTPTPRWRLLLERGMAVGAMTLFACVVVAWVVNSAIVGIGEDVPAGDIYGTFLGAWPLLMVFLTWSIVLSVLFNEQKMAMGASFALLLVFYIINFASAITERLNPLANATPFGYYKFDDLLFGEWSAWGDMVVLAVITIVLTVLGLMLFREKELPT